MSNILFHVTKSFHISVTIWKTTIFGVNLTSYAIKKFASIQINPNRLVNFSAVFAIVLFLPLFFSTLAQPPAGNSSTLELLPLLTKPDRRKDARSHCRKAAAWLPILVILVAMTSIQSGASLAKSLFPVVGAPGVTALRLALGTLILVVVFKPWRLRFSPAQRVPLLLYGLALGAMNYLFYLSAAAHSARRGGGPGVYRPAGGGAVWFAPPARFCLGGAGGSSDYGILLPLGQNVAQVDLTGALFALGAGACWAVYILTGHSVPVKSMVQPR